MHGDTPSRGEGFAFSQTNTQCSSDYAGINEEVTHYYSIAGMRVAMSDDSGVYYFASDHLSSASIVMSDTGVDLINQRFEPFGKLRENSGTLTNFTDDGYTDFGFTGQRDYSYIKLIDYGARWYSPYLNRWTQPDTIIPDLRDSQSLNRYSYVRNNPVLYSDPTGHLFCPDLYDSECLETPDEINHFMNMVSTVGGVQGVTGYDFLSRWSEQFFLKNEADGKWYPRDKGQFNQLDYLADLVENSYFLFGERWIDGVSYVILGDISPKAGLGTYYSAYTSDESSDFIFKGDQLHPDFEDGYAQLVHFWAPFASATGGVLGAIESQVGAFWHDWVTAWPIPRIYAPDATAEDYALSLVAIDLGQRVAMKDLSPLGFAELLRDPGGPLGVDGPGSGGWVSAWGSTWPMTPYYFPNFP